MQKYVSIVCPVCEEFCFTELQDDNLNDEHWCRVCGWKYDYEQYLNHDLANKTNTMSVIDYQKWFVEQRKHNPSYEYYIEHMPPNIPHQCPVCGKYQFKDNSSFDVCPICDWEDDGYEKYPELIGANGISFIDYCLRFRQNNII